MTELQKQKTFLQRPEGKTAVVLPFLLLTPLLVWGFLNLPVILAWFVAVLTNTLYAAGLAAALALFFVLVTDKRLRTLAWLAYKGFTRWLTGCFIEIDPIGILRSYVDDLHERRDDMRKSIDSLSGQMKTLKGLIDENDRERERSLKLAGQAKSNEALRKVFILQSRQAGRLQKSNMSLKELYSRMEKLLSAAKKVYESAEFLIQDIESEVEVRTAERKALLAGYNAFKTARRIVEGGGDEREMYDLALEKLAEDYGMKMGEIETFMEMSQGFIQSVDLENGVYEQDALEQLEQWEKRSEQLLTGNAPGVRVAPVLNGTSATPSLVMQPSQEEAFADLFEDASKKQRRL
jgi:hypothetical protein